MSIAAGLILGFALAAALGGELPRAARLRVPHLWALAGCLAAQTALRSPLRDVLPASAGRAVAIASAVLLGVFALGSLRRRSLWLLVAGVGLNALALVANAGSMPITGSAAHSAGLGGGSGRLEVLGAAFALPRGLPFTHAFSIGDVLGALGIALVVVCATGGEGLSRRLNMQRLALPLTIPCFRRLAAGKLVSTLGDWLTAGALVGWLYEQTHSTTQVAALLLVRIAPLALGSGLAAALVDRLPKHRLLFWIETARGATVGAALASVIVGSRPLVFAAIALSGAMAAISSVTSSATVPALVDDERLPAANAGLAMAEGLAMTVGALAAGIALTAATVTYALAADIGTFVVAAGLYFGIRARPGLLPSRSNKSLRAGWAYVRTRPILWVVVGSFGLVTLATGLTNATMPRLLGDRLGLGPGGYAFGLAALAAGLLTGQALAGAARIGRGDERSFGWSLLLMALIFACLGVTAHAPTALLVLGLMGVVNGAVEVMFETIVQREADPAYYGRVFGFAAGFFKTTMMGAVALAPVVNAVGSPAEAILLASFALLLGGLVALRGAAAIRSTPLLGARQPQSA